MAPRGRGGKFSKPSRGGGKHYSRDIVPLDKDGNPVSMWRDPVDEVPSESEEEEESGSSEEESSEDEAGPSHEPQQEMTREQRRAAAKARKEAAIAKKRQQAAQPGDLPPSESEEEEEDDDLPANPNHTAKSRSQAAKGPAAEPNGASKNGDLSQLTRREREAIEAQQARERYMKLHAEGKTEEARADLARLAIIRERREAERARKQAEKEEKEALAKERAEAREREKKLREAALGKGAKKGAPKKK
ncbi:hypothetical protein VTN00DRAFT_7420 [Thermoascus crustaceus]|uniref:uncharacterized protein n=1 Tax=Thermoascus crustaceus TaxID=5088 RepID=UPI0037438FDC